MNKYEDLSHARTEGAKQTHLIVYLLLALLERAIFLSPPRPSIASDPLPINPPPPLPAPENLASSVAVRVFLRLLSFLLSLSSMCC